MFFETVRIFPFTVSPVVNAVTSPAPNCLCQVIVKPEADKDNCVSLKKTTELSLESVR